MQTCWLPQSGAGGGGGGGGGCAAAVWCGVCELPAACLPSLMTTPSRCVLKDYHVFCVDISPSMGQPGRHGDSASHLETSLKVMNQMVQQKVLPTWRAGRGGVTWAGLEHRGSDIGAQAILCV